MIRSAKLLPLAKGARTWLAAGTIYGPKAATDGSTGGAATDESSSSSNNNNNNRYQPDYSQAKPHHVSSFRQQQQQPSRTYPHPAGSGFRLTGYDKKAGNAASSTRSYPQPQAESGCASRPGSSSGSSSSEESSPKRGVAKAAVAASAADKPVLSPAPCYAEPQAAAQQAHSRSSESLLEKWNLAEASGSDPARDIRIQDAQQHSRKGSKQQSGIVSQQQQQQQQQPSKNGKQQHQQQQQQHGRRSNAGDSHRLVSRVCGILQRHGWGSEAVRALEGLNCRLNAYQVNEVLKQQREAGLAYSFFQWATAQQGFRHDVHTYTTMLGILGRSRDFGALNALLADMLADGCQPNVVTYNRLIHCFGRAHDLNASLKLFSDMQRAGCEPDRVTYCTLIDLQAKAGFHEAAMDLYRQMQRAGFEPDTFTCSVIIHCLGRAGKLGAAYRLFREMPERGLSPSLVTYNTIIDLHAKAGKYDVALRLYGDLRRAGHIPDRVTYGILMEVLGHCGHIEAAEGMFAEMEAAGWAADRPIFGLMVDMWGRSGDAGKAAEWFGRMLDAGLSPNVPACNSLLSAYLRAGMYAAAGAVLDAMAGWRLGPTLQTYTSLLGSCAAAAGAWEREPVLALMRRCGHVAHGLLCTLAGGAGNGGGSGGTELALCRSFFLDGLRFEAPESRRGFADSLIDFLHRAGLPRAAGAVWQVAGEGNLYPQAVRQKAPYYWSINLHVMSTGTALVALVRTLASFRDAALGGGNGNGGEVAAGTAVVVAAPPQRVDIITGWGKRSRVTGASLVKQAVEELLVTLRSPFCIDGSNAGCFVGEGKALLDWLVAPQLGAVLLTFAC